MQHLLMDESRIPPDKGQGWKNLLNNLRLVIQPFVFFNLLKPWLRLFPMRAFID